jgi:hypothetical protein
VPEKSAQDQLRVPVESLIITLRGQRVILDSDLARLYGVTTTRLNEQVKRNPDRFPPDFMFSLSQQEFAVLISQIATSKGRGGRRKLPNVFTEHGALMVANVLNSPRAVHMSVFVVRAFIRMRAALADTRELSRKLADLERDLKARLDVHESAIVGILQQVMKVLAPPVLPAPRPRRRIGFGVKEAGPVYRLRRRRRSR